MLRTLLVPTTLAAASLFFFFFYNNTTTSLSLPFSLFAPLMAHASTPSTTSWSSPFAGWHARALESPLPDPHTFTPTPESLVLAVLLNAQAEHQGMTLALFSHPSLSGEFIAVDTLGRVLNVPAKDATGILDLAKEVRTLPDTGGFRNTWIIKHDRTSQPIDRMFIPAPGPGRAQEGLEGFRQVSVQGFSKETRVLKEPVEGMGELPDVLWELAGLVKEARDGGWEPERRDQVVLGKVREVLKGLF